MIDRRRSENGIGIKGKLAIAMHCITTPGRKGHRNEREAYAPDAFVITIAVTIKGKRNYKNRRL